MTLPKDFQEQLSKKSDVELCQMLEHGEDYLPEALAVAREELQSRNLLPERLAWAEETAKKNKAEEVNKAEHRLAGPTRVLLFLSCLYSLGLILIFLAVYWEAKGYKRKAKDCWLVFGIFVMSTLGLFLLGALFYALRGLL